MSLGGSQTTILAYIETGEAAQSRRPLTGPTPTWASRFDLTYDDLLHLAVWWVTENRGRGPDFVAEVAVVFDMLEDEISRFTRLLDSPAKLVTLAPNNVHRSPPMQENR